ncbi:MAG: AAA family ATPase [Candidatus Woesebacteria bacterium]|nr:AAA family ATPase [Candidatus Woesebacteria bacterium]
MSLLNPEQAVAVADIVAWFKSPATDQPFYLLTGSAGTGKTFCVRELINHIKGRIVYTAPTNKATKVLRESVTTDDYKPECRTIYSLLGLRMEANGELKELKIPDDAIDLSIFRLVIVDEGSMVNKPLFEYLSSTAANFQIKVLVLGDPAQLPPVGEQASPIWSLTLRSHLTKVMRHDNSILDLATRLRDQVDRIAPTIKLTADNNGTEGIWRGTALDFNRTVMDHARAGAFTKPNGSKVISWRNVEVDRFNKMIRAVIFPQVTDPWVVGDRVLFTGPARDLDDEPMASTDDEGEVHSVAVEWSVQYPEFRVWRIGITLDDNRAVVARVLHQDSQPAYAAKLEQLSAEARSNSRKWKAFWEFKDTFHQLRWAYAITAHRSQGSTYDTAFVNWQDILLNRNRQEAFRCLYVACTRPKRALILS